MAEFAGRDLVCVRGERLVFEGLGFAVAAGEALLLMGPNGSGKSSLMRLMAGLLAPAAGRIDWDGGDIGDDPEAHRARLAYVGPLDAVKPTLTVAENLRFWRDLRDLAARESEGAIDAALGRFGLIGLAALPARYLSTGQRRRLALARLLTAPAALWLLDEPTLGLDRDAVEALTAVVAAHCDGGGRAVIATHAELALPRARLLTLERR